MRGVAVLLAMAMLAGCAKDGNQRSSSSPSNAMTVSATQSVVVIGISARNTVDVMGSERPIYGGWVTYDPASGQRRGKAMVRMEETCFMQMLSTACSSDRPQLRSFQVEPGHYALGWMFHGGRMSTMMDFSHASVSASGLSGVMNSVSLSDDARLRPNTLTFAVQPNEAVYVGTLVVDFKKGSAAPTLSLRNDFAEAKKYMAQGPLADRLAERLMAPSRP